MNARFILGTLASAVVAASVVLSGAVIWIATAEPERLATGQASWELPGLVLEAVTRVLALVL
jgi:hypothetical protein